MLLAADPDPVEWVNADSDHPLLLVCEHAGQHIPARLGDMGLPPGALDTHIGWDIGARAVVLRVAETLGAPAVLQRYSRLVIDCNRPPEAPDAIPAVSDCVRVPGNASLDGIARQARVSEIFKPFHDATAALLDHPRRSATFAIHSFTPSMGGRTRPWDIGFLYRRDDQTSHLLRDAVTSIRPDLCIGMNEPYQIEDASDWFVPRHGEARGIAHSLIEIRNDHIADAAGQAAFADLLTAAMTAFLRKPQ
ncbi:N-formylglutamate amidohydrolase [Notoacmeibacter marinus]|uniref:N-formylglutamate amidohydrolase n=1 Tax=Notoacmeibacter marinus TaxID=1876515 RepID=UPI001FDF0E4B|nr:N-formylglutamate amidohydrolase [Notoacmeibacter marinus]